MGNFDIVLALSRLALNGDAARCEHQIARLRDRDERDSDHAPYA